MKVSGVDFDRASKLTDDGSSRRYATMSMSDEEFDVVTARLPRVSSSVKPWWQAAAGGLNGGRCGDDSIGSPPWTGPPVSSSMRSSSCDMLRLVGSSVTARSGIYGRKVTGVLWNEPPSSASLNVGIECNMGATSSNVPMRNLLWS